MKKMTIGLVGNPNCGKTTLFNALTGSRQQVGNWPGVTIERKSGHLNHEGHAIEVVDLPGVYTLTQVAENGAIDARIACDYIVSGQADLIINIVDASNLERNLYLTTQLLEMQMPVLLAVNMVDIAAQRGIKIDLKTLSQQLGCPVVAVTASKNRGIQELKTAVVSEFNSSFSVRKRNRVISHSTIIETAIAALIPVIKSIAPNTPLDAYYLALRLLEGDYYAKSLLGNAINLPLQQQYEYIKTVAGEESDILIADARYSYINQVTQLAVVKGSQHFNSITALIDRVILNRLLGIPIFLLIMYSMFLFAINLAGALQDFFKIASDTIFVDGMATVLNHWGMPGWVTGIIASGIGKGINTTVAFIPIIGGMFFFLALLEGSGYMARAAFVMDRLMRAMGLPGKSFVPLIVGFGCNVPGIMASRTLENKSDRVLTVLMSPFMSCGARLAIFAVFTAAFFPTGGHNIVFALYIIGIMVAIMTGFLLRRTILSGESSPLVMELPPYHIPNLRSVLLSTWGRLKSFLWNAGRLILPICVLIGALNSITLHGELKLGEANQDSLLSTIGRGVTPVFAPIGIQQDNWPATVGLVTGTLAKEVVIGTLNTLYTQIGKLTAEKEESFNFWGGLRDAVMSVPKNLQALGGALGNPVLASAPGHDVNDGVYGQMAKRFDGKTGAFAYLLFILLYVPCVSTVAVIAKELGQRWAWFSVCWGTGLAYGLAVIFYQVATFARHPIASAAWVMGILLVLTAVIIILRKLAKQELTSPASLSTGALS